MPRLTDLQKLVVFLAVDRWLDRHGLTEENENASMAIEVAFELISQNELSVDELIARLDIAMPTIN